MREMSVGCRERWGCERSGLELGWRLLDYDWVSTLRALVKPLRDEHHQLNFLLGLTEEREFLRRLRRNSQRGGRESR